MLAKVEFQIKIRGEFNNINDVYQWLNNYIPITYDNDVHNLKINVISEKIFSIVKSYIVDIKYDVKYLNINDSKSEAEFYSEIDNEGIYPVNGNIVVTDFQEKSFKYLVY